MHQFFHQIKSVYSLHGTTHFWFLVTVSVLIVNIVSLPLPVTPFSKNPCPFLCLYINVNVKALYLSIYVWRCPGRHVHCT